MRAGVVRLALEFIEHRPDAGRFADLDGAPRQCRRLQQVLRAFTCEIDEVFRHRTSGVVANVVCDAGAVAEYGSGLQGRGLVAHAQLPATLGDKFHRSVAEGAPSHLVLRQAMLPSAADNGQGVCNRCGQIQVVVCESVYLF